MPDDAKTSRPLRFGVELAFNDEQDKQLDDLTKDDSRRDQANDEIQAALTDFQTKVRGVLNKHGVTGIKENQVTPTSMRISSAT
jgi:hypothetical protein